MATLLLLLVGPRFGPYLAGAGGWSARSQWGTRPGDQLGCRISVFTKPRNSAASGQLAANASLIRVAVSLIRTATLSNRSRSVENSPLASGCCPGMASRLDRISQ